MKTKLRTLLIAHTLAFGFLGASANTSAAIVTFQGADSGAGSFAAMVNSQAAAASFDAAAPGSSIITFETALPSGVTISGGSTTSGSSCGFALCGDNVTPGGALYRQAFGGDVTFNFAFGIDAFALYVSGLQSSVVGGETLTFSDGSSETISLPSLSSGGSFIGFTDFGQTIVGVTYHANGDIVALDDVRFHSASAVPEPASLALLGLGLFGLGFGKRRKV